MDEIHSAWLYQSTTELVAELTDYQEPEREEPETGEEEGTPQGLLNGAQGEPQIEASTEAEQEQAGPVVCIPADDQADEIAGTMLAQLLERSGHGTMLLNASALSEELRARLAEAPKTILCISAVPPFAFAQARKLAQSLRKSLPNNPIVVALWGSKDDPDAVRDRFGAARPNAIVTSLADALTRVREIDGGAAEAKPAEGTAAVPALQ
jgi:hypothetical protein